MDGDVLAMVTGFPAPAGPLDLEVRRGEVVVLEGPNGSGKTSLLRALAGLPVPARLQPEQVAIGGVEPRAMAARALASTLGFALQDPRESLVGLTVRSEFRLRRLAVPPEVSDWVNRDVATLSSGEARRVSLAAAESQGAPILLLDEPTEGLDAHARGRLLRLVATAQRRGAVVAADHDGLLGAVATRRVRLADATEPQRVALPAPGTDVLLRATATTVRLGKTHLRLPALALPAGLHALAGPNGSGKSTLLARLSGLRHSDGVLVAGSRPRPGHDTRLLLPHAGDLFTQATVVEELGGRLPADGFVPPHLGPRHPLALSAGESERLALAKTLGHRARVFLLDEPEAHLDADGRSRLVHAITQRIRDGAVVVVATHDQPLLRLAHSVIRLEAP